MSPAYPDDDLPRQTRPLMRPTDDDGRDFGFLIAPKWRDDAMRRIIALDTLARPVDPGVMRRALSLIACVEVEEIPDPVVSPATIPGGVVLTFVAPGLVREACFAILPGRPIVQLRTDRSMPRRERQWEMSVPWMGGMVPWVRAAIAFVHERAPHEFEPG
jgi:hypothetical protein